MHYTNYKKIIKFRMKNKKDKKLSDLIKSLITERDELKNTIQETKEQLGAIQASINRIIDVIGTRSENSRGSRGGLMYTENIERIPSATLILKEVMRLKEELARKDESSAAEVKKSSTMFELLRIVLHVPTI